MLFTPFIFANSTLPPRLDTINTGIILEDLDSLVNLWYVKNTIKQNSAFTESSDSVIPYFTDSIVNKKLAAIESVIPLTYNKTVQSFIDLYTRKRRKQVAIMLGMADYYFPVFEEVLDAQGLPLELKYIPVIESALNKLAVSRAGATGIWQFMYPTAKLYKLNITSFVDERKDVYLSTVAAANFLKDMFNIYGDWLLVIAAYNCGPGNVNKAIRRSGGKTSFWAIYNYLPRETRGYVPAFIAANYVFHYYKDYNIVKFPVDFSITDTVLVKNKIHFGQISDILKIPVEEIRELNPQYRRNIIPATPEKKYPIRLPNDLVTTFVTLEDSIAHYKDSIFFASDFQPNEPQNYKHNYFYSIDEKNSKKLYYTVKQGDNLGFIAEWYDVSVQKIKLWNDIRRSLIREGQKLVIFVPKSKYEYYKKINSMSFDRKQRMKGYSVSKIATVTKKDITIDNKSDNYIYYKVRNGDNFWSIAKKYPGISNYDIMKLNGITDEKSLKPGQILKIRKKQ
ncbi:MAG TPA: LysM peptidoglycan-binding domain-containing protein [Bacteroidales bacterium]|nr:LysM peptidoglycan-binding domain-containing protein [Bacteroidales bacterium]